MRPYFYLLSYKYSISIFILLLEALNYTADELDRRIHVLNALGIPTQNIQVHPDCQSGTPSALAAKRKAELGLKTLGAYVGADAFVMNALQQKMESIRKLTQTLLHYPNVQAR